MKLHIQLHKSFQNSRQCLFSRDEQKTVGQHKAFSPCAGTLPCKGELCHFPWPLQMSQACVKQILLQSEHGKDVLWLWELADAAGWVTAASHACANVYTHQILKKWTSICWSLDWSVPRRFLQPTGPLCTRHSCMSSVFTDRFVPHHNSQNTVMSKKAYFVLLLDTLKSRE